MLAAAILFLASLIMTVSAISQTLSTNEVAALRNAVTDLIITFGDRYPDGPKYLAQLTEMGQQAQIPPVAFEKLKREALLSNPLVCAQPLLYIVRPQYVSDHHNTETMFQTGEINAGSFKGGGALKVLTLNPSATPASTNASGNSNMTTAATNTDTNLLQPTIRSLFDAPEGIVRDPEVSFDGKSVLFSMRRNPQDDYHIYEMNADGSSIKQLTRGAGVTDIDPIYLPSGQILFSSSREPKYCMCNRHISCAISIPWMRTALIFSRSAIAHCLRVMHRFCPMGESFMIDGNMWIATLAMPRGCGR